jgi:asparagine synthase (glutamine-hydrolysing)
MKHPIEQFPAKNTEKYREFFERIEKTNILPREKREWSREELKQTFNDVFQKYGEIALERNKGKFFMTLSGGLDSTLALALLRKNFPKDKIVTFAMGGSVKHPDILHARLAAEKFGSNHNEFIPTTEEVQEALEEYKNKFSENDLEKNTKTGDADVYLLYKYISRFHPDVLVAHDGIDELMGGYWNHRKLTGKEKKQAFTDFWKVLVPDHLKPLTRTSDNFKIDLLFPYLDSEIIKAVSQIPLEDRTTVASSKKPLREIAQELGVPKEIIERQKRGQVGMLDIE